MKNILICSGISLWGVFHLVGLIVILKLIFYWTGWNSASDFVDSIIYAKGIGAFIFRCVIYSWAAFIAYSTIFLDESSKIAINESTSYLFWLYLVVGTFVVDLISIIILKTYLQGILASWVFYSLGQSYFTGAALITLKSLNNNVKKVVLDSDISQSGFKVVTKLGKEDKLSKSYSKVDGKSKIDNYSLIISFTLVVLFFFHIYLLTPM